MKNTPNLSIIIRTLNEEKWLRAVLKSLRSQSVKDIEIIIVDSGSTDSTLRIAKEFDCKIIEISKDEFTYPHALNIGISSAKGEIIGILSGHSVPVSDKWAERGLSHFQDSQVAGVSGPIQALPDANLFEVLWYLPNKLLYLLVPRFVVKHKALDNRTAMIRKSDWQKYNFDETLTKGCEDFDWAQYMIHRNGKRILFDSKFQAKHSHSGIRKTMDVQLWPKWRQINKEIKNRYN